MSRLLNFLNFPNICIEKCTSDELQKRAHNNELFPTGSYAVAWEDNNNIYLARDPLGINKLFYGFNDNGEIVVANRIRKLAEHGIHLDKVASCSAGSLVKINNENKIEMTEMPVSDRPISENFNLEAFQQTVKGKLKSYFNHIAERWPDATFVVCLSGGLDSSIIAHMAKKMLPNVYAASFSFADDKSI
ncbi:MAG: asparagine synthase-related protein, partial [Gammaproteobacteria bacterium]|nr:asparagine synthase-related protein [Gammaproteobacteria bacterium]